MKMNKKVIITLIAVLGLMAATSALQAQSKVLSLSLRVQEHSQWCWDASSLMILNFKGKSTTQCAIANYTFRRSDCCNVSTFNWNHYCNQPGTESMMINAMRNWGVNASYTGALSWTSVQSYINASRPFIVGRSGHATVGFGYQTYGSTRYIAISDPWPGEGQSWKTYNSWYSGWRSTTYPL